ncbi:MAG: hypothetical protein ACO2Z2_05375 [Paracoccaceae bacterium]|jgi:ABC-type Fe3+-hydroxamate transport system substrate-binding protein|nr:hypothetical protein [Paracoccaceae bacterium]
MKRGSCLCVAVTIVAAGCSNKKEVEVPNTTFGAYAIDQKEIEYVSNKPLDLPPDRYVLVKPENPEGTQVIKPVKMHTFYPKSEGDAVQRNNSEEDAEVANGDYTSQKGLLEELFNRFGF